MAHAVESMAFLGQELPWHGLGNRIPSSGRYDIPTAIELSGLDWTCEKKELVTKDGYNVPGFYGVQRSSDDSILGVVGERYTILQNREAFDWFTPFLDARQAKISTCGSLAEGKRVWVLAELEREPMNISGDIVKKYLLLSHSHDGSLAVRVGFTPIRVVCANTLALAHNDKASQLIRLKHSKGVHANLDKVRDIVDAVDQQFIATAEQYQYLANKGINQNDVIKYVKKVLKLEHEKELSTKAVNTIESILEKFESGMGNNRAAISGTYWTAYNAVTEWLSYDRGHNADSRLQSLWFGENAKHNQNALAIALEMAS